MKGNGFGEKTRCLNEWFVDWNSCEQIIALYSLLSKVSATQARFLSFVLDHSLKNGCDSQELSKLEKEANSTTFLKSIYSYTDEEALGLLLSHLPLLNPGNSEARAEYRSLIPKVMGCSNEEPDYLDKCRQLLSLALVHPAFHQEDREYLTFWLSQLDARHKNMVTMSEKSSRGSSPLTLPHQGELSGSSSAVVQHPAQPPAIPPRIHQANTPDDAPYGRIYIDTPHSIEQAHLQSDPDDEDVQRNVSREKNQGGVSRGSSKEEQSPTSGNFSQDPGMKDVPMWLKSHRLHKYQSLFEGCTYEQMLNIDESYLEEKNVTKGARTKLTLCIRKLARRPETLAEIEQDMEKHGHLVQCFNELRLMLQTPIKPYTPSQNRKTCAAVAASKKALRAGMGVGSGDEDERAQSPQPHSSSDNGSDLDDLLDKEFPPEDLPSLITRAIGKGFSQLMMHTDTNEENLTLFVKLLDSALQHEVFTVDQKKLLFDWKQQSSQTLRVISSKKSSRGGRPYERSTAYTMPATPRSAMSSGGYNVGSSVSGGMVSGGSGGARSRSLRGGVVIRSSNNGGHLASAKGMSLPGSATTRTSSTLPRMSAKQRQQPIPHNATPSFLRPNSAFIQPSTAPVTASQLLNSHQGGQGFQPHGGLPPPIPPPLSSSSTSIISNKSTSFMPSSGVPPPLPPKTYEMSDTDMDDLVQRVTVHALQDDMSDN